MYLLSYILGGLNTLLRQLRLSISSIEFYKDIYQKYHGYGIRYLFIVSFIPAIIYCIFILNYLITLKDSFNGTKQTKTTDNIEYIINQLPEMQYANSRISVKDEEPIYLYNKNNDKVAVIDTTNQVSIREKSKIPFVIEADKLTINFAIDNTNKSFPRTINYSSLFDQNQMTLTPQIIKKYFADNLMYLPNLFIYLGMPSIILFWFVTFFLERSIIILLVCVALKLLFNSVSVQDATRLVMFSSGVPILLQPAVPFIPVLGITLQILQIFTTGLLFIAVWQIHKNRKFSSYL
ncbi:DUF1189 family protein [Rickettsia endosymbiont of Nabis limbatus]|uniref:DUF1189 family protein n=1 Tax=Rickettsia endosymbiont of Nabis limbatus TaxID=3066268 RepID=UPI003AF38037